MSFLECTYFAPHTECKYIGVYRVRMEGGVVGGEVAAEHHGQGRPGVGDDGGHAARRLNVLGKTMKRGKGGKGGKRGGGEGARAREACGG